MRVFVSMVLTFLVFASCSKKQSTDFTSVAFVDTIAYDQVNKEAVLLGDTISLLGSNYQLAKDISDFNRRIVSVTAASKKLYKLRGTDELCDEFKYVKIKTAEFEGILDGRKLYELVIDSDQNIVHITGKDTVTFSVTNNFAIGASDVELGLTGCQVFTPVVFKEGKSKYRGLIKMIKNSFYYSDYPYFELKDDESAKDRIESIEVKGDSYWLTIKRQNQMDEAELLVEIFKDKNDVFVAQITKMSNKP